MQMPRSLIFAVPLLLLFTFSASAQVPAAACSYREGIMALQQGNQIRGMALLRMASRDGDVRASRYLAALQDEVDKLPLQKNSDQSIVLAQSQL